MGDPFRNQLASINARVETLERENQALRERLATLNNELDMAPLRRGRASWLLSGLITSFFPLVGILLFFSAPKAPWLAHQRRAAADATAFARFSEGGEARDTFHGVALAVQRDAAPVAARAQAEALPHARPERYETRDSSGVNGALCRAGDPMCGQANQAPPATKREVVWVER